MAQKTEPTHVNVGASHTRIDGSLVGRGECFAPTEQELAAISERLIPIDEWRRHNDAEPSAADPTPQHAPQDTSKIRPPREVLEAQVDQMRKKLSDVERQLTEAKKEAEKKSQSQSKPKPKPSAATAEESKPRSRSGAKR